VNTVTIITVVWTPCTRSMSGRSTSLRWPMPKSVVVIAVAHTTNAPAIANGAGQRAASHSSSGSVNASGSNEIQDWVGCE
jgi:hypothetical protein